MKTRFKPYLAAAVLATGLCQAQAPAGPDASATPRQRMQQLCSQNPEKCQQMKDWCRNNREQCKEARQQMQARRKELQQECQQDPASCEQKKQALRQQMQQRMPAAPGTPAAN